MKERTTTWICDLCQGATWSPTIWNETFPDDGSRPLERHAPPGWTTIGGKLACDLHIVAWFTVEPGHRVAQEEWVQGMLHEGTSHAFEVGIARGGTGLRSEFLSWVSR